MGPRGGGRSGALASGTSVQDAGAIVRRPGQWGREPEGGAGIDIVTLAGGGWSVLALQLRGHCDAPRAPG